MTTKGSVDAKRSALWRKMIMQAVGPSGGSTVECNTGEGVPMGDTADGEVMGADGCAPISARRTSRSLVLLVGRRGTCEACSAPAPHNACCYSDGSAASRCRRRPRLSCEQVAREVCGCECVRAFCPTVRLYRGRRRCVWTRSWRGTIGFASVTDVGERVASGRVVRVSRTLDEFQRWSSLSVRAASPTLRPTKP